MKWLVLLVGVLASNFLYAQRLSYFSYADQFPDLRNGALSVFQDQEGWIWVATGRKILKYDGASWKTIAPANGVDMQFCSRVFELDGRICVRSQPYLLLVEGDSLIRHPSKALEHDVLATKQVGNKHYVAGRNGLFEYANDQLTSIVPAKLGNDVLASLVPFQDSFLVGGLLRSKLVVFNLRQRKVYTQNGVVHDLEKADDGSLYVLDSTCLKKIKNITSIGDSLYIDYEPELHLSLKHSTHFSVAKNNTIWIAEDKQALYQYRPGFALRTFRLQDGLPGLVMHNTFIDREGNIWLSLGNNLLRIPQQWSNHYSMDDGLPFPTASQLLFHKSQNMLLAKTSNGMAVYQGGGWKVLKHNGDTLKPGGSWVIADTIYLQNGKGIFRLDAIANADVQLTWLFNPNHDLLNLAKDSRGYYYWGKGYKLFCTKQNQTMSSGIAAVDLIRTVYVDKQDRLWIGEFSGRLRGFKTMHAAGKQTVSEIFWKVDVDTNSLKGVRYINEDKNGNLLVGTRFNGLHRLQLLKDTVVVWEQFKGEEKPDPVWDIKVDSGNNYWFAGNGVNKVTWAGGQPQLINAGRPFGITQVNSVMPNFDNKIWVSTPSGILSFDPEISNETYPVQVKITGIWVNQNKPYTQNEKGIRLPHFQNNLRITFSANSFRQENIMLYSYAMVNENDTVWSEPANFHSVNFSALAPGEYDFVVKAWDFLGNPIEDIALQKFVILAPFYARWWFILLVAFAIVSGIYVLFLYRLRNVRRLMQLRMGIAEDLHDDIGASLTNVLLLNELARSDLKANEQTANLIGRSVELIQDISQSLSDIVWNINPRSDGIDQMVARMQRLAGEMFEGANIEGEFYFPKEKIPGTIPMNKRRDFYLVFKELIHNMVRHSDATKASVSLELRNGKLFLSISDNGKGFDLNRHAEGNGLLNMKQRIETWGGNFVIHSISGKGTDAEVMLPV